MSDATLTTVDPDDESPIAENVIDFFAFKEERDVFLRGTDQYVTIKKFTEGDRRKYMNATSREIAFDKSGRTSMSLRAGDDRLALLRAAVVNWHLLRNGRELAFNERNLNAFLDAADPKLIDDIEKAVRDFNPFLIQDLELEDIDEQIAELEELRKKKLAEDDAKND